MKSLINKLCFSLLLTSAINMAYSLTSDQQQLLQISSEQFTLQYKKGIATYYGKVVATQGSRKLTGDKAMVFSNNKHKVNKVEIFGTPAHYQYLPNKQKGLVHAAANIIEFLPARHLLTLKQNAKISQNGNIFKGSLIVYNTKTATINSSNNGNGRSTMILQPETLNKTAGPKS